MRPSLWQPPVALSPTEQAVARRVRRAKLFVFLRLHRHTLLDVAFQEELSALYEERAKGQPPVPPALLAVVTILQAYTGASDKEAVEAAVMDRRWGLVLDCLDGTDAPFSAGTLVAFRERLSAADMDRRLVERTVEVAAQTGGFGHTALRVALDSSPLWGAGRVEDTYNLLGHALRKAGGVLARQQGRELADMATDVGASVLSGTSLKAALDLDWDDPAARSTALHVVLRALADIECAVETQPPGDAHDAAAAYVATAGQIVVQDVDKDVAGTASLRRGVAPDRRISIEDADMRHGRKSRSHLINGDKRHVLRDLEHDVVRVVGVTPANVPEASVTDALTSDLAAQHATCAELHIDRGYLASTWVRERPPTLTIYCKAWPVRQGPRFAKTAFHLDGERRTLTCPQGEEMPFVPGGRVQFPRAACQACPVRDRCTMSTQGRSVSIHRDERLHEELRVRQQSAAGRAVLRQRVRVEHSLAHIGAWQGDRARYRGQRKNLFDLRRMAVVHNLHVVQRCSRVHPHTAA